MQTPNAMKMAFGRGAARHQVEPRDRAALEAELEALEELIDPAEPFDPAVSLRVDALLEALEASDVLSSGVTRK